MTHRRLRRWCVSLYSTGLRWPASTLGQAHTVGSLAITCPDSAMGSKVQARATQSVGKKVAVELAAAQPRSVGWSALVTARGKWRRSSRFCGVPKRTSSSGSHTSQCPMRPGASRRTTPRTDADAPRPNRGEGHPSSVRPSRARTSAHRGWPRSTVTQSPPAKQMAKRVTSATFSSPPGFTCRWASRDSPSTSACSAVVQLSRNSWPSTVSCMPRGERSSKRAPNCVSSDRMWRLSSEGCTPCAAAAPFRVPLRATITNARIVLRSLIARSDFLVDGLANGFLRWVMGERRPQLNSFCRPRDVFSCNAALHGSAFRKRVNPLLCPLSRTAISVDPLVHDLLTSTRARPVSV
jgi:hypothetical protein